MLHFVGLALCAVAVYFACEWFVNAIEWLGPRLRLGSLAVGTVLAALGTALPESAVTFAAAVVGKSPDIAVGAAMGGPLALATVAYAVTGWMLFRRRAERSVDTRKLARDQAWFLVIFTVKLGLGLVAFAIKPWLGLLMFVAYAVYFVVEIRRTDDGEDAAQAPLLLQRKRSRPSTWAIVVQALATLVIILVASQLFVQQLESAAGILGLPAEVTALLLSPVATELPEIMNAIIWVRAGKPQLALANISGAMMIQATVPSGIGLIFTPWMFSVPLVIAGVVTMAAIGYLLVVLRRGRLSPVTLSVTGVFYLAFAALLIPALAG
ncbi:sodium:calcium antiporter [Fodinicola acaciae]|uniref:sodium:calcium antiporter n=1 Tax=Fodinicola acaciae TaxID=2681555 RepID=UPI0013CF46FF|nr:sodium:calcium antiporter [Fodinicola acaciae]